MTESELAKAIARLLDYCQRNPMRKRKWEGRSGLSITLYIDQADRRHVLLARIGQVGPSLQEARTVLAYWPEPVPAGIEWTQPTQKGRFCVLIAIWKLPAVPTQLKLGAAAAEESASE